MPGVYDLISQPEEFTEADFTMKSAIKAAIDEAQVPRNPMLDQMDSPIWDGGPYYPGSELPGVPHTTIATNPPIDYDVNGTRLPQQPMGPPEFMPLGTAQPPNILSGYMGARQEMEQPFMGRQPARRAPLPRGGGSNYGLEFLFGQQGPNSGMRVMPGQEMPQMDMLPMLTADFTSRLPSQQPQVAGAVRQPPGPIGPSGPGPARPPEPNDWEVGTSGYAFPPPPAEIGGMPGPGADPIARLLMGATLGRPLPFGDTPTLDALAQNNGVDVRARVRSNFSDPMADQLRGIATQERPLTMYEYDQAVAGAQPENRMRASYLPISSRNLREEDDLRTMLRSGRPFDDSMRRAMGLPTRGFSEGFDPSMPHGTGKGGAAPFNEDAYIAAARDPHRGSLTATAPKSPEQQRLSDAYRERTQADLSRRQQNVTANAQARNQLNQTIGRLMQGYGVSHAQAKMFANSEDPDFAALATVNPRAAKAQLEREKIRGEREVGIADAKARMKGPDDPDSIKARVASHAVNIATIDDLMKSGAIKPDVGQKIKDAMNLESLPEHVRGMIVGRSQGAFGSGGFAGGQDAVNEYRIKFQGQKGRKVAVDKPMWNSLYNVPDADYSDPSKITAIKQALDAEFPDWRDKLANSEPQLGSSEKLARIRLALLDRLMGGQNQPAQQPAPPPPGLPTAISPMFKDKSIFEIMGSYN